MSVFRMVAIEESEEKKRVPHDEKTEVSYGLVLSSV